MVANPSCKFLSQLTAVHSQLHDTCHKSRKDLISIVFCSTGRQLHQTFQDNTYVFPIASRLPRQFMMCHGRCSCLLVTSFSGFSIFVCPEIQEVLTMVSSARQVLPLAQRPNWSLVVTSSCLTIRKDRYQYTILEHLQHLFIFTVFFYFNFFLH